MSNPEVFILHCSVNASVRQSVQIAFEDYKLPTSVIDTLKRANALYQTQLVERLKDLLG